MFSWTWMNIYLCLRYMKIAGFWFLTSTALGCLAYYYKTTFYSRMQLRTPWSESMAVSFRDPVLSGAELCSLERHKNLQRISTVHPILPKGKIFPWKAQWRIWMESVTWRYDSLLKKVTTVELSITWQIYWYHCCPTCCWTCSTVMTFSLFIM